MSITTICRTPDDGGQTKQGDRWRPGLRRVAGLFLLAALVGGCAGKAQDMAAVTSEFQTPERVTIVGYDGEAMEPFLSRDGKYLFFNNLNEPSVNTDLFWAERVDDLTFRFKGEIAGVNTATLEGVASMDRAGNFYFVSPRSYEQTASTLYRGKFADGAVRDVELAPGVSAAKPGIVNFDAEISADGNTLYFVASEFGKHGPRTAKILIARRHGNALVRDSDGARIFEKVNAKGLNYAPATSASELELYFTRADQHGPAIYVAKRASVAAAFEVPRRIESISGFAEGPTLSPDERSLYFHKKDGEKFVIYRVTRGK